MDATTPTAIPPIHNTFGAIFISVLVSGALWGITCMQTYEYFEHSTSDHWILKSLVTIVFISDTFHQALMSHAIYSYLVTNYFDPTYLIKIVWSLVVELLASAVVSLIAQGFFTWRVWILSRGRKGMAVVILLVCLVLGNFIVTIVYFVRAINTPTFTELPILSTLSRALNVVGVVADVAITMAMIWLLHSMKTGFHRSNQMISRLILFSLSTGLLTTLCALMCLISISVWPNTLIFIGFYACLGRLYTNSLLASLNARKRQREMGSTAATMSLQEFSSCDNRMSSNNQNIPDNKAVIFAKTETETNYGYSINFP